jgi:predicted transcriptional regulator
MEMKFVLVMVVALLLAVACQAQRTTLVSYLAEYEAEERQDFLELTVSVSSFKSSLQEAIAEAREKAENIKTLEEEICSVIAKSKTECKGSAEVGNVRITPKYEENKKELEYKGNCGPMQASLRPTKCSSAC